MSLVNEALKRAECEQPRPGGESPADSRPEDKAAPAWPVQAPQKPNTRLARAAILGIAMIAAVSLVTYLSLPPGQKTPSPATAGSTPAASQPAERLARPAQPQFRLPQITAPGRRPESSAAHPVAGPATQLAQEHPGRAAPASPAPEPKSRPPEFRLGAIMRSSGLANAIINNHLVTAGDMIDGARVLSIEKYHVVLEKDGKQFVLRM